MSLRNRLVAAVLAISAGGLLLLGGVTYAEQRTFLMQRVDQRVRDAPVAVAHLLTDRGIGGPANDDHHAAGGGGGGGGGGGPDLPAGTYAERRSAAGTVLGSLVVGSGETSNVRLKLPATIPTGHISTVSVAGTRYRLMASPDPGGGTTAVAVPLTEVDQTLQRLIVVEALVIAAVLALLALVARVLVRAGLRPLERMGVTAGAIAAGDLSHRIPTADARTETGRLGVALNAMLDRLELAFAERQASEERLRRFLADASHELRTPLTSIRGYAELFRVGAVSDAADTARAMERIEAEATRMGVLVEDLLTLARLDQVADAPHLPVDLDRLAADAVDDARASAPERAIRAEYGDTATVRGDADQLRQVLANLVRNAVAHTPEGTPIDVSVAPEGSRVTLTVRDHGAGLPGGAGDALLFERFWRAQSDGGRRRGPAGAGLGLAIVAAIVAAHGGEVRAENAPDGGGARFVVSLPAIPAQGAPRPTPSLLPGATQPPVARSVSFLNPKGHAMSPISTARWTTIAIGALGAMAL